MNSRLVIFAFVSLLPYLWTTHAAQLCTEDLTDTNIQTVTASSQMAPNDKSHNYGPDRAALNSHTITDNSGVEQSGGWVAEKNDFNQWIQFELKDVSLIRGVLTQGHDGSGQEWVTKYRVLYSEDCKKWHTLGGCNTTDMFFTGNKDENTPYLNLFDNSIIAKCVRVNPLGWNNQIAMRVGLLGCQLNLGKTPIVTSTAAPAPTTKAPTTLAPTTRATTTPQPPKPTTTKAAPTTAKPKPTTAKPAPTTATPKQQAKTKPPGRPYLITSKPLSTPKAAVNPTQMTSGPKKGSCITSCMGRANGDYQSCTSCDSYVTCVWNSMYDNRPCPKGLTWDDSTKKCELKSSTCP